MWPLRRVHGIGKGFPHRRFQRLHAFQVSRLKSLKGIMASLGAHEAESVNNRCNPDCALPFRRQAVPGGSDIECRGRVRTLGKIMSHRYVLLVEVAGIDPRSVHTILAIPNFRWVKPLLPAKRLCGEALF
jgi:hypothetical protein